MAIQPGEFNSARLVALAAHGALLEELIQDFLSSSDALVSALKSAAERGDLKSLVEISEALRSPAMTLGLERFARVLADLGAANKITPDVLVQVASAAVFYERAVKWLKNQEIPKAG
jgi:fatty acid/phospholipid biosynthesis enzyme